jgi:hypothetical protein
MPAASAAHYLVPSYSIHWYEIEDYQSIAATAKEAA